MVDKIKEVFQLTDKGAKGLIKASVSTVFSYISYMLPLMFVMYFIRDLLMGNLKTPMLYVFMILGIAVVMYMFLYVNYNTLYTETYRESKNLRIDIANILKELPLSYFSRHDVSDLAQTIMKDVEAIEHALSHAIPQAIGLILFLIIVCISMLANNFKMALAIILPVIISFVLLLLSKRMQVYGSTKYYNQLRVNSDKFQEAIELQQEIRSYNQGYKVREDLLWEMDKSEKIHITSEFSQALPLLLSSTILKFALGFIILFGTNLYINGDISLLYFLGYVIGSAKIVFTTEGLYENIGEIMYLDARINRIRELRNTEIQKGERVDIKTYDIEIKDVEFSYNEATKVIDGISFVAKQDEVTAIVGPSGCGKTTVLRLMSRLYDYDKGSLFIGGNEIMKIDTDSLFDKISIVFQDVMLFNTSIMENIRMGNKEATDEEVKEAARLANCTDFIKNLPQGYETVIGENGSNLSGGERQRISIARAILKNAPIILLDEISASLDVENEMQIQNSLNSLIKNKTVVIISHRLKSVENADKIVVMNNGKIDSIGKHKDLLKKSKLYKNMIEKSNITESYLY
ncbi:MAG: ABC transporter ATP-binding protein [Miniphocaeibacter sp.]|uniref:ABC transporter ATP-binding protein n=1 Tax=Miniphocaeibacter sp. TaxID=3100973 RepID=UPI0017BA5BB7|nr:ABC transporter ATP-binding protein [Gallicola sp.]